MAVMVFTCPTGSESIATSLGQGTPRCVTGEGSWVAFEVLHQQVTTPTLPTAEEAGTAFGAGFVVVGTGLLLAMAVRFVIRMVSA